MNFFYPVIEKTKKSLILTTSTHATPYYWFNVDAGDSAFTGYFWNKAYHYKGAWVNSIIVSSDEGLKTPFISLDDDIMDKVINHITTPYRPWCLEIQLPEICSAEHDLCKRWATFTHCTSTI